MCSKRFADMMRFMTQEPVLNPEHLVNGFPWAELGEAVVVDLGNSHGAISCALARRYPSLKPVVHLRDYLQHQSRAM
jgi:6-hydroxytryprostatin B O-methyltransferase